MEGWQLDCYFNLWKKMDVSCGAIIPPILNPTQYSFTWSCMSACSLPCWLSITHPFYLAFCAYTAFLAWNGMTEAFVYAVESSGSQEGNVAMWTQ